MKYQHVFFDLDHTLWDFESNSKNALQVLYEDYLIKREFSFDDFITYYKKVNDYCWKQYREGQMNKEVLRVKRFADTFVKFGFSDEKLANTFAEKYLEISPYQTQLMPGTISLLDYLVNKNYRLHMITNGFEEVQTIKMRECGLNPFFDKVIISEQLDYKKPHPSVFLYALDQANAAAETSLMVGDNLEVDIMGAQNVGMGGVFYNPKSVAHKENVTHEIIHLNKIKEFL